MPTQTIRRMLALLATAGRVVSEVRVVLCLLLVGGTVCAVTAAHMLSGTPAALITASAICFVLAYLVLRSGANVI